MPVMFCFLIWVLVTQEYSVNSLYYTLKFIGEKTIKLYENRRGCRQKNLSLVVILHHEGYISTVKVTDSSMIFLNLYRRKYHM